MKIDQTPCCDPYLALKQLGLKIDDAPAIRASYLRDQGALSVGNIAKVQWNYPAFTLGFEYGLLALAAILKGRTTS